MKLLQYTNTYFFLCICNLAPIIHNANSVPIHN